MRILSELTPRFSNDFCANSPNVVGNGDPTDAIDVDLTGYQDVTRIEVYDITDTYGLSYDDFKFRPNAIPEPTTAAMLGVCVALALAGRSKRYARG